MREAAPGRPLVAGRVGVGVEVAALGSRWLSCQRIAALAGLAVGVALVVDAGAVVGLVEVSASAPPVRVGGASRLHVAVGRLGRSLVADVVGLVVGELEQRPLRVAEGGPLGDDVGQLGPEVVPARCRPSRTGPGSESRAQDPHRQVSPFSAMFVPGSSDRPSARQHRLELDVQRRRPRQHRIPASSAGFELRQRRSSAPRSPARMSR